MRNFVMTLALAGGTLTGLATAPALYAQQPHEQVVSLTPAELTWTAGPPMLPPGASMAVIDGSLNRPGPFTVRLKFPANYRIPPHWHPAKATVTVISGTLTWPMAITWIRQKGRYSPLEVSSRCPQQCIISAGPVKRPLSSSRGLGLSPLIT